MKYQTHVGKEYGVRKRAPDKAPKSSHIQRLEVEKDPPKIEYDVRKTTKEEEKNPSRKGLRALIKSFWAVK